MSKKAVPVPASQPLINSFFKKLSAPSSSSLVPPSQSSQTQATSSLPAANAVAIDDDVTLVPSSQPAMFAAAAVGQPRGGSPLLLSSILAPPSSAQLPLAAMPSPTSDAAVTEGPDAKRRRLEVSSPFSLAGNSLISPMMIGDDGDSEVIPATQQPAVGGSAGSAAHSYFAAPPPLKPLIGVEATTQEEDNDNTCSDDAQLVIVTAGCSPTEALPHAGGVAPPTTAAASSGAPPNLLLSESTATFVGDGDSNACSQQLIIASQQAASTQSPQMGASSSAPASSVASSSAPAVEPTLTLPHRFLSANYELPSASSQQAVAPSSDGLLGASATPLRTVFLPWDARHRYRAPNGRSVSHWDRVVMILREAVPEGAGGISSAPPLTPSGLAQLIRSVQPDALAAAAIQLDTLEQTLKGYMPLDLVSKFLSTTVPWMVGLLEGAPALFAGTTSIPILSQGYESAVRLTQAQTATLLVCGFFCLMPYRYHPSGLRYGKGAPRSPYTSTNGPADCGANLPAFNFNGLLGARYSEHERRPQTPLYAKIACLINYFIMMSEQWATIVADGMAIEVARCARSQQEIKAAFASAEGNTFAAVTASTDRLIEDCVGQLQADFANQVLGGGVLGKGCVQEEIRMVVSPELLLGLLVCETLRSREAVLMSGCAQYSHYSGYAREFAFAGPAAVPPPTALERQLRMRDVSVVAYDALNFNSGGLRPSNQFDPKYIDAEIIKAYVAFCGTRGSSGAPLSTLLAHKEGGGSGGPSQQRVAIATGHWGCGAFGGDRELKFLIQLCAAAFAGERPMTYCTFGDAPFTQRCMAVYHQLVASKVTAGRLYRILIGYHEQRARYNVTSIFDYLLC